jgi:hypothetical protein
MQLRAFERVFDLKGFHVELWNEGSPGLQRPMNPDNPPIPNPTHLVDPASLPAAERGGGRWTGVASGCDSDACRDDKQGERGAEEKKTRARAGDGGLARSIELPLNARTCINSHV